MRSALKVILCVLGSLLPAATLFAQRDGATIVAFSRHTFRGVNQTIGAETVTLQEQLGRDVPVPALSYGYDATPHGRAIAHHAADELPKAAALALREIRNAKPFDGQWDEIRADFATQRTFWTALYLRERLGPGIPFRGCEAPPNGTGTDVVSSGDPVKGCVPAATVEALQSSSPYLGALQTSSQDLLNVVSRAIGTEPSKLLEPSINDSTFSQAYASLQSLAGAIEMTAELRAPLEQLFPNAATESLRAHGRDAVAASLSAIGVRFFVTFPDAYATALAAHPAGYITSRPRGRHTIVVTHDDFISALLRGLELIAIDPAKPLDRAALEPLQFYPLETLVFAYNDTHASVVRMRIVTAPDGSMPGPYESRTMWKGTRAELDERVARLRARARRIDFGQTANQCLAALDVCTPDTMNVLVTGDGPGPLGQRDGGLRSWIATRDSVDSAPESAGVARYCQRVQ